MLLFSVWYSCSLSFFCLLWFELCISCVLLSLFLAHQLCFFKLFIVVAIEFAADIHSWFKFTFKEYYTGIPRFNALHKYCVFTNWRLVTTLHQVNLSALDICSLHVCHILAFLTIFQTFSLLYLLQWSVIRFLMLPWQNDYNSLTVQMIVSIFSQ